jgi:hypothetical protein
LPWPHQNGTLNFGNGKFIHTVQTVLVVKIMQESALVREIIDSVPKEQPERTPDGDQLDKRIPSEHPPRRIAPR